jgi:hypothetical protein
MKNARFILCLIPVLMTGQCLHGQQDTFISYFSQDFESSSTGRYDSASQVNDWPMGIAPWADSWKTESEDSLTIGYVACGEENDSSKAVLVTYFRGNKGTTPDSTCNNWIGAPLNLWCWGSGERFTFTIENLVDAEYASGPIGYGFNAKLSVDDYAKGGKFGFTILMGKDHGEGACAPDSTEGFSHILMWSEPKSENGYEPVIVSYVYQQVSPYDGCDGPGLDYAEFYKWDEIDSVKSDAAVIPGNEWFSVFVLLTPNTFADGKANSDGMIQGWMNGRMFFRKRGIMFIHEGYEQDHGEKATWCQAEFATFFGGCNTNHLSTSDEYFWYDDYHLGRPDGPHFPEQDTVDRNFVIDFDWMRH